MARHAAVRLRLVAASAVLAAGLSPLLPSTAVADVPQETVVPAALRDYGLSAALKSPSTGNGHDAAGAQGVFHTMEGRGGLLWTRYADGESVSVPAAPAGTALGTTGTDVLAYKSADRVDFWDATDGTSRSLRIPEELGYVTSYDNLTIGDRNVTAEDGTSTRQMHLLTPGPDGTTADLTVTGGPAGLVLGSAAGADSGMLYFRASVAGEPGLAAVDRATGEVRGWSGPLPVSYSRVSLGGGHVVVHALDKATVLVLPRDLSAAPVELRLAGVSDGANATYNLAVVGDWLVNGVNSTTAQPLAGGAPTTLLRTSQNGIAAGHDGTAVKIGNGTGGQGIQRLTPGADGGPPVVTLVKPLPKPALPIQGLSLEQGRLVGMDYYREWTRADWARTVAASGTPAFGERGNFTTDVVHPVCTDTDVACGQVNGTADGRIVWLSHDETSDRISVHGPGDDGVWERTGLPPGGRVTDVSGRYLLFTAPTTQYVLRLDDDGAPVVTRSPGAAALSGDVLWTAGTTPGAVTAYDLTAKKTTETLTTDAGCTPTELQALGRYLYWTCDGKAGVYDRTAKQSVSVPTGEAKLGDGYVVTHDKQAGKLTLTTVAGGTPASRVIGDLPDTGVSQRDVRWTVDESGANAAYVDGKEQVHLVPSGVPQQPLRLLAPAAKASSVKAHTFDTIPDTLTTLLLSKPTSGWDVTVRNRATGKVYGDRVDGTAARGELNVGWSGLDPKGTGDAYLPNGSYDWTVTVTPADGVGDPLTVTGTVKLVKGTAVRRDHVGDDGFGELLTLNSSGALTFQQSNGKGTFSGKVSASGWPTSVKAVPFGDLSGDRCNDVLVRPSSGALRLYKPGCGAALKPSTPYTSLGTSGWNQYDVLTAPGDVTKDGRPDLIARNTSTGAVYLYKGTSSGKLSARVKLYDNWKTYKKVVGAGDLNGDGIGDLLAQDKSNNLYRYYGKGNGTFAARVKVFTNWGGSYNVIVGVGDITGDGKADLVSRDSGGNVWRNNGNGKGSFGARVKIASGWQGYKGLF
ncbi:FG-GAP repeat domain-containing protein [Streptomyces canus]|uniref:FG-GAP repeat domain-containing protein n=1 Tax=Streptomyces canus TaxID=58343 RepID=UPI003679587C